MKKETLKVLQGVEVKKHYKTEEYQIGHVLEDIAMLKPKKVVIVERQTLSDGQREDLKGMITYAMILEHGKVETEFLNGNGLHDWLKGFLGDDVKKLYRRLEGGDNIDIIPKVVPSQEDSRLPSLDRIYVARDCGCCEQGDYSIQPELVLVTVFGEERVRSLFSCGDSIKQNGIQHIVNTCDNDQYEGVSLGNLSLRGRLKRTKGYVLAVPENTVLYY